jgi:integrase
MSSNSDWKTQLDTVIAEHNTRHAVRNKLVSHSTMDARAKGLFRAFRTLRALGFKPVPENLCGAHIFVLMRYWTADPELASSLGDAPVKLQPRTHPYSAAYIQQQLSFLRVFASWIGKPGLVQDADRYTTRPEVVRRHYSAQRDKGWTGNGVDVEASIEAVAKIDLHVAAQMRMVMAFGLRRKEAVMFRPYVAEVPDFALPATCAAISHYVSFLRIKRGTKGGRLRFAAIRTQAQRDALASAKAIARFPHSHLGRPGLSLKQSLDLFSNVVRAAGLTKKTLGVTPHGLRHEFAGDLYYDIANVQPPVRGGDPCFDPDTLRAAYQEVALQLGHNRPQISNAYLGSPCAPRDAAGAGNV